MPNGRHKATGSSIPVNSLSDFVEAIEIRYPVADWYFRGEPAEYDRPFLPSVWRTGHSYTDQTPIQPDTSFSVGELLALQQCRSDALSGTITDSTFLQHFKNPQQPIDLASVNIYNWLSLAQHHNQRQKYPTRLVDVTTDPYVGLYFAVSGNFGNPGFVFVFQHNFNDLATAGKIKRQGGTFLDVLRIVGNDGLKYHPNESTLNLLKPPFPNRRLEAQCGLFIWNRAIDTNYATGGFPFEIRADDKRKILDELNKKGYNEKTLFPA